MVSEPTLRGSLFVIIYQNASIRTMQRAPRWRALSSILAPAGKPVAVAALTPTRELAEQSQREKLSDLGEGASYAGRRPGSITRA